jgi:glycosyltransferase involved in cell wall biosynthesis
MTAEDARLGGLSVVIPNWNGHRWLPGCLESLAVQKLAPDEVIVVDNGSTDATAARAAAAGARVIAQPARGYGSACLTGALAAAPDAVLLFLDGDGSDDPGALARVTSPVRAGEAELVLGSRALGHREAGALPAHQRAGNRATARLIGRLWQLELTDLGPLRAIRRSDLLALDMRSRTYGWPVEMIVKAARAGMRIAEVPVDARRRTAGRSKVGGSLGASVRTGARFGEVILRHGLPPRRR